MQWGNSYRSRDMVKWMCHQPSTILWSGICILPHQTPKLLNTASDAGRPLSKAMPSASIAHHAKRCVGGRWQIASVQNVAQIIRSLRPMPSMSSSRRNLVNAPRVAPKAENVSQRQLSGKNVPNVAKCSRPELVGRKRIYVASARTKRIQERRMGSAADAVAHAGPIPSYARNATTLPEQEKHSNLRNAPYVVENFNQRAASINIVDAKNVARLDGRERQTSGLDIPIGTCVDIVVRHTRPKLKIEIRSVGGNMQKHGGKKILYLGHCQQQRQSSACVWCAVILLRRHGRRHAALMSASVRDISKMRQLDRHEIEGREHARNAAKFLYLNMVTCENYSTLKNVPANTGNVWAGQYEEREYETQRWWNLSIL